MTIRATIYDANDAPVSSDFLVTDDDFSAAEAAAKETAAAGTKCCIRWTRESDDQTAYYGPRGVTFRPHWYSPIGRPAKIDGRNVNVYLDKTSLDRASELGNGNVSEGIRLALKK